MEILTPARKSKGPLIWVCLGLFKCPWWLKIRLLWNVASCSTLWLPGRHFSHVQTTLVVVVVDSLTNKSPGTELLVSGIILRPKHHNDYLGLKTSVIPELVIWVLSCWWHILGGEMGHRSITRRRRGQNALSSPSHQGAGAKGEMVWMSICAWFVNLSIS